MSITLTEKVKDGPEPLLRGDAEQPEPDCQPDGGEAEPEAHGEHTEDVQVGPVVVAVGLGQRPAGIRGGGKQVWIQVWIYIAAPPSE